MPAPLRIADEILSKDDREALTLDILTYARDELDIDMGNMDAGFLLDKMAETLGAVFYNKGLQDAGKLFAQRAEDISDDLYALEKPWSGRR